jgi:CENP-Q, a CENPA-CAD centromere complex subunit
VLSDGPDSIGLVSEVMDVDSLFDTEDPDLAPILAQLTSHLESIRANSQQVEGIADGIFGTRAALERVLPRDAS